MFQPFASLPRQLGKIVLQFAVPLIAFAVFGGLLWQKLATMDMAQIGAELGQVTFGAWALAALATYFSFQAIGRYDGIWHRIMQTGVSQPAARRAGIRAVALAQTIGFGAITASLVRWRCLPGMNLWQASQLSVAVTLTFTACWLPFALIAIWWLGTAAADYQISPIWLGLLFALAAPMAVIAKRRFASDLKLAHLVQLLFWTGVDMLFAAAALYVLLPDGIVLPFDILLAAYVIALGIGLISNSPGGTGAFDLTLLALVSLAEPEPLMAAIIAFRVVYYLIPALLALVAIARPARTPKPCQTGPAHWQLARQTGEIAHLGGHDWLVGDAPLVQATLGAQPRHAPADILTFGMAALLRARVPALYNCDPRTAHAANRAGWHVRRVAMEAIIRPAGWSTDGSRRQSLRRKLRNADKAGVSIVEAGQNLPLHQMTAIAAEWAIARGGELGFSMGRFGAQLIRQQRVFLIRQHSDLLGFITFHESAEGWSLDLIRHRNALPDGAMHAAITTAIAAAKQAGIAQVSLAAVPDPRHTPAFWADSRAGLIQFKRSFGPVWVPRYHAAPNRAAFWITGVIIAIAIHRPVANLRWKAARLIRRAAQYRPKPRFPFAVSRQT